MHICDANKVYYVQQDLNFSNEVIIKCLKIKFWKVSGSWSFSLSIFPTNKSLLLLTAG